MIYTIIDTETSGLPLKERPNDFSRIDIWQVSYIQVKEDLSLVKAESFYMYHPLYDLSANVQEAVDVNHITRDFLRQQGNDFQAKCQKLFTAVSRANLVTFNGNHYDIPLINSFLGRYAVMPDPINMSIDIMAIFQSKLGHRISLVKAIDTCGISSGVIESLGEMIWGEKLSAHDSRYDTVATYRLLIDFRGKGYV